MMDSGGFGSVSRGVEQDLDGWTKRLLAQARPGNLGELAGELALRWRTAGDVRRGIRAVLLHALFEQRHFETFADLLCCLRAQIPELPRERGLVPVRFTQQLVEVCREEIGSFLRICLPVDRRTSCVVTCTPDPGLAVGGTAVADARMRVRCSMIGVGELGVFDVPRDSPYGSELGRHIRRLLGNSVEVCVNLVSEDGRLLWKERAALVLASLKALLEHLGARYFLSGSSLELLNSAYPRMRMSAVGWRFLCQAKDDRDLLVRLSMIQMLRDSYDV